MQAAGAAGVAGSSSSTRNTFGAPNLPRRTHLPLPQSSSVILRVNAWRKAQAPSVGVA
jgi:hypothetical protein